VGTRAKAGIAVKMSERYINGPNNVTCYFSLFNFTAAFILEADAWESTIVSGRRAEGIPIFSDWRDGK